MCLLPFRLLILQNAYIEEILRHIDNDVRLLMVVRGLLEYVQPSADVLDSPEIRTLLDLCGVIARRNGAYQIKSAAWEHLLRARLSAGYIGRLFARAGDWNRAITYLGQAQSNQTEVDHDFRPELFAAIINAIHDSRDERQTFAVLDAGLRAAYPSPPRDLLLYAVDPDGRAFGLHHAYRARPLFATGADNSSASDRPEVQACSDTEYSISSVDGVTRLLYPLPSADSGGDPLGLVSADEGTWLQLRLVNLGASEEGSTPASVNAAGRRVLSTRFRDLQGRTD